MKSPNAPYGWLRNAVQLGFLLFTLLVGWQFHRFVGWLEDPKGPPPDRPESVEAWLPISSLMSLTYLVRSQELDRVHPAGLVILSLTLLLTVLAGRGFCSWVCPIGTLSEWSYRLGKRIFGQNLVPPRWLDLVLRSLKYLLLAFFLTAILSMSLTELKIFLDGAYNRVADVKMYLFFAHLSLTAALVLTGILALSLLIKNFWCRYLCPYGALLGIISWLSPARVRRDLERCTGCGRCQADCPNRVAICRREQVASVECTRCFSCVEACPVSGAIHIDIRRPRAKLSPVVYALVVVTVFVIGTQLASTLGWWKSDTTVVQYAALYRRVNEIEHPRSWRPQARSHVDASFATGQKKRPKND